MTVGKAWQRQVREREQERESANRFSRWWEHIDRDIAHAVIRPIDHRTAATIIKTYEWMQNMPAITWHCFGIYFGGHLGGAVVYAPEYAENLGVWDKYGYTGKIILLARGACVHWAHPHAGSKLIRGSMKLLPPRFEVVTATVDEMAGEVGTIYQACGFHYVGKMKKGTRTMAVFDGRSNSERSLRRNHGTSAMDAVSDAIQDVQFVKQVRKGRYFAFRGSKKVQREHLAAISHLIQPYPKREIDEGSNDGSSSRIWTAGDRPQES